MPNYTLNTNRLAECREKLGISKMEAARRVGVSQPAYLRYETGERMPSMQVIREIAQVLQTSSDYLLNNTDSPECTEYIITKASNPELFVVVERCLNSDKSLASRLIAYIDALGAK